MKRSTRYYYDPHFRVQIDCEEERARHEAALGGWVTYAIHDPTRTDNVGEFNTLIMYVGRRSSLASGLRTGFARLEQRLAVPQIGSTGLYTTSCVAEVCRAFE